MNDLNMSEAVLVFELGQEIIQHLCGPMGIDQDHAIGQMLAALNKSQNIDMDRVLHFYSESMKNLNKER